MLKQRCRTHTLPAASTSTPITSPHSPPFIFAGKSGQRSYHAVGTALPQLLDGGRDLPLDDLAAVLDR